MIKPVTRTTLRHLRSSNFPSCTMATWYDLPAEVKQNILEHVVDRLRVQFEPRHAATRATRNAKEKQKDKEAALSVTDALNSLLLVSKRFVLYNELEGVILTNATICTKDLRVWNTFEKRYGRNGIAMVKEVVINSKLSPHEIARSSTRFPDLHPYLKTKMSKMRRVVIDLTYRVEPHSWILKFLTHDMCKTVSKGHTISWADLSDRAKSDWIFPLTTDVNSAAKHELQQLLVYPLMYLRAKQDGWATNILNVKEYPACEVLLEWDMAFGVQSGNGNETRKVQSSSTNWCVNLQKESEVFLCPQRLDKAKRWHGKYPWLVDSVNAVEHDKYYTV